VSHGQRLTLVAAIVGSGVAAIDGSIVNVALPAIERDLGGGLPAQQWVSNAYLLALGSLILVGGSLGDIYGERRIFALGVAGFGLLSLACAVAPTIETLIAARALQGAAGALLTPSSLAIIVAAFPPKERGAAIGSWTAWGGIAAIAGPLAGGWIVDQVSWRWIFALNVPLVLVTLALIFAAVPRTPRVAGRRVDVVGAALCVLGLLGLVFALIEQPRYGWGSAVIAVPLLGGVLAFCSFLVYERRIAEPMLKLELFARRNFAVANLETLTMYAGLSILFFFLVIFLQQVDGYSALRSGLTTIPVTVVMFVLSRRFGALADRHGPRLFMGGGPLVAAAGILLLLRAGMHASYVRDLLPGLLVFSLGLSMTVAPLTATVMADANEGDAGIASAVNNAVARVAGLVGVSAIGVVIAGTLVGDTFAANAASVRAFHEAIAICAALIAAGGLAGAVGITNPRRTVKAESCPGGQLVGSPLPAAESA
jgi:EmrB/QacA subfamily drug resistance transporter